jgi:hypothetical protein
MPVRYLAALALAGCASATFHSATGTTLPPIADRALLADASIAQHGQQIGTVNAAGNAAAGDSDLDDKAALVAAASGGTHLVPGDKGVVTSTYTTPASESTTCTDNTDSSTCTTTYTPESESTVSTPYASYSVFRVDSAQWNDLAEPLRPTWDPARHVPTAADGWGLTMGGFSTAYPGPTSGTSGDVFPTAYTADMPALQGFWMSGSRVSGSNELAFDLRVGGTSFAGTAMNTQDHTAQVGYTGIEVGTAAAVRIGKRVAWSNVALAAGGGIGGALWMTTQTDTDPNAPIQASFIEPGQNVVTDLYAPLWASVTVKPSCNWGVQGLAEYDVRPFDGGASAPSLSLGVIWQPATACF